MGMSFFAGHKNEKWLVALDEQYMELEKQKPPFEEALACPEARSKWIELMGRQQEISARILPLLGVFEVIEGGKAGDA